MKRIVPLMMIVLLLIPLVVSGQQCGNGLPCGPLPWPLPHLPILVSPTPMPTIGITLLPTSTPQPTPTHTPTPGAPTPTPEPTGSVITDFTDLAHEFSTLQAMVNATPMPVEISGTPVDTGAQLNQMGESAGTFFGYVRGISEINLGGITPFISFAIISTIVVISLKAAYYILPIAVAIFGIIIKIIKFIIAIFAGG